jgi:hypothetical protein
MLLVLVLPAMLTTACATVVSEVVCPALPEYTLTMQREAAEELKLLPPDGVVRGRMMPDYGTMRDEVRACRRGS